MTQVIIVDTLGSPSACEQALQTARSAGSNNSIVISPQAPAGLTTGERFIALESGIGAALLANLPSQAVCVLLNANIINSTPNALPLLKEMMACSENEFRYEALRVDGSVIAFGEPQVDELGTYLSSTPTIPLACCAFPTAAISSNSIDNSSTFAEVVTCIFVYAVAHGLEINQGSYQLITGAQAGALISQQLSKQEAAAALRYAVLSCNIEDLFPNHAWAEHGEESASASFHSLAGMFLRLEDLETASQCLSNGDRFEDSPRSLALQGLIALRRGETLGAVAKMITSLQEYENRKRNNGSHYLTFNPNNFEGINASLTAGLAALNKRDNGEAVKHFSQAIFEFDPFYRDMGLLS